LRSGHLDAIGPRHHASTDRALAFAALGVVFGDIGTSPLYAVKECFGHAFGLDPVPSNVFGIISLFFWALFLVVVIKYVSFVMRADNRGEGGILSLMALVTPRFHQKGPSRLGRVVMYSGLVGASLLAADGTITPAISVLSAMEGLEVATPKLKPMVIPGTVAILISIFLMQRHGTAKVARIFAPAMLLWFVVLALLAIPAIVAEPRILGALNPVHGIKLLLTHGWQGFLVLGAVVLCLTGAEALYADMGHFGRRPIKLACLCVALPSLMINYLGQGALLLLKGEEVAANPFYGLVPQWGIYPMVALSTLATVIASQALISGSFSLAQQAIQLGYSPRLTIIHTSEETKGQIYIPEINFLLMVACVMLVFMFRSSSALAAAYGISVMGTMSITSFLMYFVAVKRWKWNPSKAIMMVAFFLFIDLTFLTANLHKIMEGGWFTILISGIVLSIMVTWKRGRSALARRLETQFSPINEFIQLLQQDRPHRVPGTAVFMTGNARVVPPSLRHHFEHNQVLHRQVILLSILTADMPFVPLKEAVEVHPLGEGFYEVIAHTGFMQSPKVEKIFRLARLQTGLEVEESRTTYFLGRDILLVDGPEKMMRWRKLLFSFLARNSLSATAYFGIPPNRVIEIGMQVVL
jgi:KUP system potassium uptake protein